MNKVNLKILFKDRIKNCGYYDPNTDTIEVNTKITLNKFIETLYHEYTHFVCELLIRGVGFKFNKKSKVILRVRDNERAEHAVCKDIESYCAKRILKFIKENTVSK